MVGITRPSSGKEDLRTYIRRYLQIIQGTSVAVEVLYPYSVGLVVVAVACLNRLCPWT